MDLRAILLGLAFVLMWSSAFTSARIAVADAPPFLLLTGRFLISGMLAIALARAWGQRLPQRREAWIAIVIFGLCQNGLYLGLNFVAMQWVEASLAVLIASLLPLSVAASRMVIYGERLPGLAVFGLLLGFGGLLVVAVARLSGGADPLGVFFCVLGLAALTVATLQVRGASGEGNLLMVVGLQMLVSCCLLFPLSLLFETWTINWTTSLVVAFTYTTLFPGLLATLTWFVLVGRIGETRAASFHFLNPGFGVAVAALVLSETLTIYDVVGVSVVMVGILATQMARQRKTAI